MYGGDDGQVLLLLVFGRLVSVGVGRPRTAEGDEEEDRTESACTSAGRCYLAYVISRCKNTRLGTPPRVLPYLAVLDALISL